MMKLKLQDFAQLMWSAVSLEYILMLGNTEDRRRRGWQRMRWLDGITDSMHMSLSRPGRWWGTGKPGVLLSLRWLRAVHYWASEKHLTLVPCEVTLVRPRTDVDPSLSADPVSSFPGSALTSLFISVSLNGRQCFLWSESDVSRPLPAAQVWLRMWLLGFLASLMRLSYSPVTKIPGLCYV